ncbi:MAG: radical SAM protein [Planctomycetaceae bacterium]|nr:radical SAM protein [Planctomycetales bacterium]MCB9924033.1 radical SAM protein [Planctomycetaceae bacterium]
MVAFWQAVRRDLLAFRERIVPSAPVMPGLYTYRFGDDCRQSRVHLRIEPDRSGVLFVDVTDVVHLNATAAELTSWAFDGISKEQATSRLIARHGSRCRFAWEQDLDAVYEMAARLASPEDGCPTCSLASVERAELFSTGIQAPYKADLALTYDCNNDCPHCYNEADRLAMGLMSGEQWKQVIAKLTEVGIPHLIFTGGEATLHPDFLDIVSYADRLGPICGLNTNARRLSQRSYTEELAKAGLNHVQVTLGSHRAAVHDRMMNARCFEQTVRGIENAIASGMHTITNTTLMRMNAEEIEATIEFLHSLGIRTFAINGMIYSGGGFDTGQAIPEQQMAPILIGIRDKAKSLGMRFLWYTPTQYCRLSPVELDIGAKRCNAGEYSLCVEPNGDVLPCQSYYVSAGNVLRDSWESMWNGSLFKSFRERELDPQASGLPEMCWQCPDLPLCGGGCRIEREAQSGIRVSGEPSRGCGGCGAGGCHTSPATTMGGFVSLDSLVLKTKRRGTGDFANATLYG